jgi:hypothetical protein
MSAQEIEQAEGNPSLTTVRPEVIVVTELIHDNSRVRVTMVHLPAMNTPQFSWVKSRLPRKPQPVPPIYQPEIGAEAVLFAARHDRREMYVGYPTVQAIIQL